MDIFKTPKHGESPADYVLQIRKGLNLTQFELADAAGIHSRSVGKIERGLTMKLSHKTLSGLALALSVPVEYLQAVVRGKRLWQCQRLSFVPNAGILVVLLTRCGEMLGLSFVICAVHSCGLVVGIVVSWWCR